SAEDEAIRKAVLDATKGMSDWINLADIPARVQAIITVADEMNNYFADQAPWNLIKNEDTKERCQTVIYVTLDSLRVVMEALTQVIPTSAGKALSMLNAPEIVIPWKPELDKLSGDSELGEIETLFPRVQ
ncbi:MAG: methionine--tRNA ligase, partial [Roseibium sp.]